MGLKACEKRESRLRCGERSRKHQEVDPVSKHKWESRIVNTLQLLRAFLSLLNAENGKLTMNSLKVVNRSKC